MIHGIIRLLMALIYYQLHLSDIYCVNLFLRALICIDLASITSSVLFIMSLICDELHLNVMNYIEINLSHRP